MSDSCNKIAQLHLWKCASCICSFDRGFEERLAVLRQLLLRTLEFDNTSIQASKEIF